MGGATPPATHALNRATIDNTSKSLFMFHFLLSFPRMLILQIHPMILKNRAGVHAILYSCESPFQCLTPSLGKQTIDGYRLLIFVNRKPWIRGSKYSRSPFEFSKSCLPALHTSPKFRRFSKGRGLYPPSRSGKITKKNLQPGVT